MIENTKNTWTGVAGQMIIAAALLIPLAPHSRFISEALPAMTIDFPFVALLGIIFLYPALRQARNNKQLWLLIGCWAAFSLLAVISWLFSNVKDVSDLFAINRFAYFGALLLTAAAADPRTLNLKKICRAFYAAAFIVALFGLLQYFFYAYFINDGYINAYLRPGMDRYTYYYLISDRVLTTFGNPNLTGVYLGVMLMIGVGSSFWGFNNRWTKIVWVTVLITALALTRSRTAYICLVSGYLFMMVCCKRTGIKNLLYTFVAGAAIFGIIMQLLRHNGIQKLLDVNATLEARFQLWEAALNRFTSSPLLGVGPNPRVQIPGENLATVPIDNIYLTVLTSYGLLGFLALLAVVFIIGNLLVKAGRVDYTARNLAGGLGCGLFMLVIAGFTGDFLFNTKIAGSYLLFLGCFLLASSRQQEGPFKILLVGNAKSIHIKRWGKSLADKGLSIHILSPESYPVEGCSVHEVGSEAASVLSLKGIVDFTKRLLLVEKRIKEIDPDIVHIQGAFSFGWYATSFTTGPVITSIWGGDIYRYATAGRRKKMLVRSTLKRSDLITVPTAEVAADVKAGFSMAEKIHVLPWGIDEHVFYRPQNREETETVRESLQIPLGARLILSPRSLTPVYNVETILKSIPAMFKENNEDIYFVFLLGTGSTEYLSEMQKKADELGVKENTRWITEFQTPAEMARLFRAADAFISVPDSDNIGSTITEGMACGSIPIVKRLNNYRCLYDAGAAMISIPQVTSAEIATAIPLAIQARTPENLAANETAAHTLGTWQKAVDNTSEIYSHLIGLQPVKGCYPSLQE